MDEKAKELKQAADLFVNLPRIISFGKSLSNVDAKEFLSFVDIIQGQDNDFVRNCLNFEDVDWNPMVQKLIQKLSPTDKQERRPVTEFNKPLL